MVSIDQGNANEIGGIFRVKFSHNVSAMDLDSSRTYSEMSRGFLIGGRTDDFDQKLCLPPGQRLTGGNVD